MLSETYKQVKDTGSASLLWHRLIKAIPIAFGFTLVIFTLAALLLTHTALPEEAIPFIAILTAVISAIVSGLIAARGAGSKGYLTGALAGILYVLLLYVLSFICFGLFICFWQGLVMEGACTNNESLKHMQFSEGRVNVGY